MSKASELANERAAGKTSERINSGWARVLRGVCARV